MKCCMSDVEKFSQTLLDYFAMLLLLLCLMAKMVELKELYFVMQMESSFILRTVLTMSMEIDPDYIKILMSRHGEL